MYECSTMWSMDSIGHVIYFGNVSSSDLKQVWEIHPCVSANKHLPFHWLGTSTASRDDWYRFAHGWWPHFTQHAIAATNRCRYYRICPCWIHRLCSAGEGLQSYGPALIDGLLNAVWPSSISIAWCHYFIIEIWYITNNKQILQALMGPRSGRVNWR